jgi:hypothetical protein
LVFTFFTSVLLKKRDVSTLVFVFFHNMQENLQAFIYEKIPSNFSENYENATGGACGTRAATVAAGRFSSDISGQPMVDPGRYDVKDSYGGGLDGR